MTVHACVLDFGKSIGVAWEYEGKRDSTRLPNPHWPEINRKWHAAHPEHRCTTNCEVCGC